MLIVSVISVFIFVAILTGSLLYIFVTRKSVVQQRLEKLMTPGGYELKKATLIQEDTPLEGFLGRVGKKLPTSSGNYSTYARTLVSAGYRKESVPIFLGGKLLLAILLPAVFILLHALPHGVVFKPEILIYEIVLAVLGFLLPSIWLQRVAKNRQIEIFHTLPDVLDLLTVCVEAGVSMDAALVKACENPQFSGNPLTDELSIVSRECRAGKPRSEAMKDMAERTMVDDVRSFVSMMTQTERFGTSLAQSLRVHSDALRTKRRQIAEESAAKTSVKMLFPLVFFVFPALLVVLLGPAVILLKDLFK